MEQGFYVTTILQETWIKGGQKAAESSLRTLPALHLHANGLT